MFGKPGTAEKAMFIVMAVFFALSLVEGNPVLLFYATLGVAMAGYLFASAKGRPSARR